MNIKASKKLKFRLKQDFKDKKKARIKIINVLFDRQKKKRLVKRLEKKEEIDQLLPKKLRVEIVRNHYRSSIKESAVLKAYKIRAEIDVVDVRTKEGDWLFSECLIKLNNDRKYKLRESFNDDDNRTDFAEFKYVNKDGQVIEEFYENYADAEKSFVNAVKMGL